MGSFGTVPDEPRDQPVIKLQLGEEQLFMMVNEFLLNGSIKPFHGAFYLGEFWTTTSPFG
jgi:hypothetical protein